MLINMDTPLINLNCHHPVDNVGREIDVGVLPIHHPHPSDLCAVCHSIERILLPLIDHVIDRQLDLFAMHNPTRQPAERHIDGLVSFILFQHIKLAAFKEDSGECLMVG